MSTALDSRANALSRSRPKLPLMMGACAPTEYTYGGRPQETHEEFRAFLDSIAKNYPRREIHLICDNYGTHKHPKVKEWLAQHPRFQMHFTPTSASWLNLVERWFAVITNQAIRRGSFDSVRRLERSIARFLAHWNEDAKPFRWTKSPKEIRRKIRRVLNFF